MDATRTDWKLSEDETRAAGMRFAYPSIDVSSPENGLGETELDQTLARYHLSTGSMNQANAAQQAVKVAAKVAAEKAAVQKAAAAKFGTDKPRPAASAAQHSMDTVVGFLA